MDSRSACLYRFWQEASWRLRQAWVPCSAATRAAAAGSADWKCRRACAETPALARPAFAALAEASAMPETSACRASRWVCTLASAAASCALAGSKTALAAAAALDSSASRRWSCCRARRYRCPAPSVASWPSKFCSRVRPPPVTRFRSCGRETTAVYQQHARRSTSGASGAHCRSHLSHVACEACVLLQQSRVLPLNGMCCRSVLCGAAAGLA